MTVSKPSELATFLPFIRPHKWQICSTLKLEATVEKALIKLKNEQETVPNCFLVEFSDNMLLC